MRKLIKPLLILFQDIDTELSKSELRIMSNKHTKVDRETYMYDRGSMDTYKQIIDILVKEGLITRRKDGNKK